MRSGYEKTAPVIFGMAAGGFTLAFVRLILSRSETMPPTSVGRLSSLAARRCYCRRRSGAHNMSELELNELDEARLEIGRLKDEIERLRTELVDWRQATETLRAAIQATALDGKYNEAAIRKAVSFELAELIVAERNRALEDKT
jgi:uncharacterized small protein (DUF1192 family)